VTPEGPESGSSGCTASGENASSTVVTIRPITAEDAETYREIRLRAHAQEPKRFASSLEAELQLNAEDWAARTAALNGDTSIGFLAFDGENACGIVEGAIETEWRGVLQHLWVDPAYRAQRVSRRLIEAVSEWAGDAKSLHSLRLAIEPGTEVIIKMNCSRRVRGRRVRRE
jgi:GNAT superfamily N-acetyltransferase